MPHNLQKVKLFNKILHIMLYLSFFYDYLFSNLIIICRDFKYNKHKEQKKIILNYEEYKNITLIKIVSFKYKNKITKSLDFMFLAF